jgi:hypothetical protein
MWRATLGETALHAYAEENEAASTGVNYGSCGSRERNGISVQSSGTIDGGFPLTGSGSLGVTPESRITGSWCFVAVSETVGEKLYIDASCLHRLLLGFVFVGVLRRGPLVACDAKALYL